MIKEMRITNLRAIKDSGVLRLGPVSPVVGQNDVGKSAILYALKWFFEPPKKGGLSPDEIHGHDTDAKVTIELAFDPSRLQSQELLIDARNPTTLGQENLLDQQGLLRLRYTLSTSSRGPTEACIHDLDDPDLFGLGIKGQSELLELLQTRGLPAVAAGTETNVEKRNTLREHTISAGCGWKQDWINVSDKESAFRSVLPEWRFFTDEARYGVGETPVQTQFKGVVDRAIRELQIAEDMNQQIHIALQSEFDKVHNHLTRLTDTVEGVSASADVNWKKAVDKISLEWIDSFDVKVPYEMRGSGVRRLFMVAYFQYEATEGLLEGTGPRYVFAIEEPEVHLHPGAQRVLLEAFQDLAEAGHQIIFTTHSPVFAAMADVDALSLVTRTGIQARVFQTPDLKLDQVARALGVQASDRLIGRNYVILVEGLGDAEFYEEALSQLAQAGLTTLDPRDVLFLQCGGIDNLEYVATRECMDKAGLCWAVITDSDRAKADDPPKKTANALLNNPPASCKQVCILGRTSLENYLDSSAIAEITSMNVAVPLYGKIIDLETNIPLSKWKLKNIKDNMKSIATAMGTDGLVACSLPPGKTDPNDCEFVQIFEKIRVAFGL